MKNARFVHLRIHTDYSISNSIIKVKPLMQAVNANNMQAVALTDTNNLFAVVKFFRAALGAGVKPIIGADLLLENPDNPKQPYLFTGLCQHQQGYKNLMCLISLAYTQGQATGQPIVKWEWVAQYSEGLIILSGAHQGDVGQALLNNNLAQAKTFLQRWQTCFADRYYLEIQRLGRDLDEKHINLTIPLALEFNNPVVATNDVQYLAADDFEAHEARVCIHDGYVLGDPKRPKNFTMQQYLRSEQEMCELFADIPEALENTVEISKRCNVALKFGEVCLPNFPVPAGQTVEDFLINKAKQGLEQRLAILFDKDHPDFIVKRQAYDKRLAIECDVINQMGFPGYFLIVADFIEWSKTNGIPVGPGRGSGAGSLVAYALNITDLDPLAYDLLFERFLNPERVSMPDFDIDFCMEGRDEVIEYVAQRYGRESVSQIITYGTMAAKAVIRDVGRVLGHPYGFVDKLAKLIPFELGITLDKALAQEDRFRERYETDDEAKTIIDLAKKLEGVVRNAGKHAGGVVIAPSALTDYAPLYCEPNGENVVTQFDKDDVESVGLVKFDFLGLRTLTIIDWAVKTINKRKQEQKQALIDISLIPLDDEPTYQLLQACKTTAIFQLESRGMKDLIRRLQPSTFSDIIDLGALFRPGPLQSGMVDDFVDRKHGRAEVVYPHEAIMPILKPTNGVILFQEQVMQIAQVLAGYTLGGADLLRRAMGKKKPEEMAKQREIFNKGAVERGVDPKVADQIFDLMEKFSGYGFNKSHSAAYALVSYQTAWLKTHYPAAFMAAVLSSDMDNTDKVLVFVDDCRQLKLPIIPPNINVSHYHFTVDDNNHIIYGLGAIKGVGEAAVELMLAEREQNGDFKDLFDFCSRLDLRKVNRRVIEALVRSGAMDDLGPHRASLLLTIDDALKAADQLSKNTASGQTDMFGLGVDEDNSEHAGHEFIEAKPWNKAQTLQAEKESLGFYFSGHPLDQYQQETKLYCTDRLGHLTFREDQSVTLVGQIVAIRTMLNKRGDRMAFVTIDDGSGRLEVAMFSDIYKQVNSVITKDQLIVVVGDVSVDHYTNGFKLSARQVYTLAQAREIYCRQIQFTVDENDITPAFIQQLQRVLKPFCNLNGMPIAIQYKNQQAKAQVKLGDQWRVRATDELLAQLRDVFGETAITIN